jgi:hypothetical protein
MEKRMKPTSILTTIGVATVIVLTAFSPVTRILGVGTNVHARSRGCTNASLRGTYATMRTGINQVLGGPIAIIGVTTFDGDGTFGSRRTSASRNGVIEDWTDLPPGGGGYTVDSDCTGSIFADDGTKTDNIVVLDGGNEWFLISTLSGRIITEVGRKIDGRERE